MRNNHLHHAVSVSNGQVIVQYLSEQGAERVRDAVNSGHTKPYIVGMVGPSRTPYGYMVQFYIGADKKDPSYTKTIAQARDAVRNIARATIRSSDMWNKSN